MDTILLIVSLTSFLGLVALWVGLPQTPATPPVVVAAPPAAQLA